MHNNFSWTIDALCNIISNVDELNKYIVEYSPDEKIIPSLINKLEIIINKETLHYKNMEEICVYC